MQPLAGKPTKSPRAGRTPAPGPQEATTHPAKSPIIGEGIMWFLKKRFAKKAEDEKPLDEHLKYLNSLKVPAIGLGGTKDRQFNKLGGLPNLPEDLAWPEWNEKPLAFLCQLDLSTIPAEFAHLAFPRSGGLYFFYDSEQSTWGFDPKDKGSWRVLYAAVNAANCPERKPPEDLDEEAIYIEKFVACSLIDSYPDVQDDRIESLKLGKRQFDEYLDLCAGSEDGPSHQLFGYPSPVQGNGMQLECQLVSNGLYCGDATGYNSKEAKILEAGQYDWTLLLQLDTDDDAGMMWGDAGMLYFWIKKDDLAAGRFENCWMILQCG
ncbi:MAG: YwqG family protein [Armatimonadota bacterium]